MTDVVLYQAEWCPYSHRARHTLTTHGVTYLAVNVPAARDQRNELEQATGQRSIPALIIDGEVFTDWSEIGRAIAERFPANRGDIGAHEKEAAPAAAARLDSGDIAHLVEDLRESFSQEGFALVDESVVGPGATRSLALVNDELNERLAEIEPRLRPALPLRISIHRHDNGAVASVLLPNELWMHFHNRELNKQAYALTQLITRAIERVGTRAGVA